MSNLKCLERLKFEYCKHFTSKHYEALSKNKFHLKELKLWLETYHLSEFIVVEAIIESLYGKSLLKLALNVVTPKLIEAIKKTCPNIRFLRIKFFSKQSLNLMIKIICGSDRRFVEG